jgi:hypothetical protein
MENFSSILRENSGFLFLRMPPLALQTLDITIGKGTICCGLSGCVGTTPTAVICVSDFRWRKSRTQVSLLTLDYKNGEK